MTIQPHDFSRPPSLHPDTRARLVQWVTRANTQFAEVITGFGFETTIQFEDCTTAWPMDSLQQWSEKAIAFRIKLPDAASVSLMAVPNPLAQVLIGVLMGERPVEWPVDRDLSLAEEFVGEFIVAKFADSLNTTWPEDSQLNLKVGDRELNLRRTRCFKFQEPLVVCRSTVKSALGSGNWSWMLSPDFLGRLFGTKRGRIEANNTRQQLESMARDMTTQVTIRLGGVQLSAPQLAELRVGDLVVLNQKTTEPLRAMVSGNPRFLGWPGRVGGRQAFEISTDGTRRDRTKDAESSPLTASQ